MSEEVTLADLPVGGVLQIRWGDQTADEVVEITGDPMIVSHDYGPSTTYSIIVGAKNPDGSNFERAGLAVVIIPPGGGFVPGRDRPSTPSRRPAA